MTSPRRVQFSLPLLPILPLQVVSLDPNSVSTVFPCCFILTVPPTGISTFRAPWETCEALWGLQYASCSLWAFTVAATGLLSEFSHAHARSLQMSLRGSVWQHSVHPSVAVLSTWRNPEESHSTQRTPQAFDTRQAFTSFIMGNDVMVLGGTTPPHTGPK